MITRPLAIAAGIVGAAAFSACTAHADPPKFPDLSSYTPVNVHDYEIEINTPGMSSTGVYFATPDGVECAFGNPPGAGCTGNNFPGIPPATPSPSGGARVNDIGTDHNLRATTGSISSDNPDGNKRNPQVKTLPPFHSIAVDGVICGVDDKKMTACKDPQGRGFILSPSWSGWLPHV